MQIAAKNWGEFQHYKDRDPSWIKLHKRLLDDYEFQTLPIASKALAPMLWLLCSESKDGTIETSEQKLAFRLRMSVGELTDALMPLVQANFFHVVHDAINPLAETERAAIPEKKEENKKQVETEKEYSSKPPKGDFEGFWVSCPRKVGKGAAKKAYLKALLKTAPETLDAGIRRYASTRAGEPEQFTVHPATWLNDERWLDATGPPQGGATIHVLSPEVHRQEQENLRKMGII